MGCSASRTLRDTSEDPGQGGDHTIVHLADLQQHFEQVEKIRGYDRGAGREKPPSRKLSDSSQRPPTETRTETTHSSDTHRKHAQLQPSAFVDPWDTAHSPLVDMDRRRRAQNEHQAQAAKQAEGEGINGLTNFLFGIVSQFIAKDDDDAPQQHRRALRAADGACRSEARRWQPACERLDALKAQLPPREALNEDLIRKVRPSFVECMGDVQAHDIERLRHAHSGMSGRGLAKHASRNAMHRSAERQEMLDA